MIPLEPGYRNHRVGSRRTDYQPAPPDCNDCVDRRVVVDVVNNTARPGQCAGRYQAARDAAATPPDRRLTETGNSFAQINPAGPPGAEGYPAAYQLAQRYAANPAGMLTSAGAIWRALRQEMTATAMESPTAAAAYRRQRNLLVDDVPLTPAIPWEHEQLLNFLPFMSCAAGPNKPTLILPLNSTAITTPTVPCASPALPSSNWKEFPRHL